MGGFSTSVNADNINEMMPKLTKFIGDGVQAYGAVQVELTRITRSIAQNALWHAQIGEIAKQTKINGAQLTREPAKHSLVLLFAFEKEQSGEPLTHGIVWIPSRKMQGGLMPIPPKTSDFNIEEGGEFIDWLFMYGAERNVRFNDDVTRQYEAYLELQR